MEGNTKVSSPNTGDVQGKLTLVTYAAICGLISKQFQKTIGTELPIEAESWQS